MWGRTSRKSGLGKWKRVLLGDKAISQRLKMRFKEEAIGGRVRKDKGELLAAGS